MTLGKNSTMTIRKGSAVAYVEKRHGARLLCNRVCGNGRVHE